VPIQTLVMTRLNMLLLFLVAVEPYFFNFLIGNNSTIIQYVSSYYAIDIGCINLVLAYFVHQSTIEEKKILSKDLIPKYRANRDATIVIASIFLVSAIPIFWGIAVLGLQLRIVLWISSFPMVTIVRKVESFSSSKSSDSSSEKAKRP
jgi:hypothetical protein